ncbi:MAG: hypothetical protein GY847_11550 [Proteobacteria bacterium]|nr:hypothetical protein [Pseudomonadota bacterium]
MNRPLPRIVFAIVFAIIISMSLAQVTTAQYKSRPVINTIDPPSGPPGTKVTISGGDFSSEYKVYFNGQELKPIEITTDTIIVEVPKGASQGRFILNSPTHQVMSRQVFWVVKPVVNPAISTILPVSGAPGTVVTIKGKNFSPKAYENTVKIADKHLKVTSSSEIRIEAIIPMGAKTGSIAVQIYNAGQTKSNKVFTVLAHLEIDSVKPQTGLPGSTVILTGSGSGFSTKKNWNTVTLAGKKCKVVSVSPKEISVQVPAKGAATGRFAVKVKGVGTAESPAVFKVTSPPKIDGFDPITGSVGQEVVIQGSNFGTDPTLVLVLLNGKACQILSMTNDQIRVNVPGGAVPGPFEVVIKGVGNAKSKQAFEVWAPISVTKMDPVAGLPGTEVRIWGTGFKSKVKDHILVIDNKTVKIDRIDNGALVFKIPQNASDGQLALRLEVKDRGATLIDDPFVVMHSPVIDGFSPDRGPAGTKIAITGKHFGQDMNTLKVLLGNHAVEVSEVTPTMIRLTIPPGAPSGRFEVQAEHRGRAVSKREFETYVKVEITVFLPSSGYAGEVVSLFGSGFSSVAKRNTVTLAGRKIEVLSAKSTKLRVKLPKDAKPGKFRVEVPERGYSETASNFTVIDKLAVKSFTPNSGLPGAYVTVNGQGFTNRGLNAYLGQSPIGVRIESASQITVAVPQDGEGGQFVFAAPGAGRAASKGVFKVLTPLTLSGFEPAKGPPGTKVTIHGTGFNPTPNRNKVFFGDKAVIVRPGSTEKKLVVKIPKESDDRAFTVKVKGKGGVESENVFTVVRPNAPKQVSGKPTELESVQKQPEEKPEPASAPAKVATSSTKPRSMDDLMGINPVKIESFEPVTGPVGEVVIISGAGFGEKVEKVKAWLGKTPATVVGVVPDMLTIEIPVGVKRGKIRIKVGDNETTASKNLFTVTE